MKETRLALLFVILTLLFFNQTLHSQSKFINYEAIEKIGSRVGYVNDYENILTSIQKQRLDSIINKFLRETSNEVVIVTIDSVSPYSSLKDFTTDLGNFWGVGQKNINNGLIITISKSMRQGWIGTGLGTEQILTNEKLQVIFDSEMIPRFRKGEYYEGLEAGLIECIKLWK